jgi:hypothetical protein
MFRKVLPIFRHPDPLSSDAYSTCNNVTYRKVLPIFMYQDLLIVVRSIKQRVYFPMLLDPLIFDGSVFTNAQHPVLNLSNLVLVTLICARIPTS